MADDADGRLLLLDTCGETGSVALAWGEGVVAQVDLPERMASAAVVGAMEAMLRENGVAIRDLAGVGVVNGPGSFTGVRVGLAVAKGLCEAASLAVAAVSRLQVLAEKTGLADGYALLRAGRDQLFVRRIGHGAGKEALVDADSFLGSVGRGPLVYVEDTLAPLLEGVGDVRKVELSAGDALSLVRCRLRAGGDELSVLDANYVRDEEAIYARQRAGA